MQTTVTQTGSGFSIAIAGCTIQNLGQLVPAFFGAFPNGKCELTAQPGPPVTYTFTIPNYPVPQLLGELINGLNGILGITGG